jgi:hypothetical protein
MSDHRQAPAAPTKMPPPVAPTPEATGKTTQVAVAKLADVVKDTRTYLVSGLIIIVAWMLLVDTYVEHRGDNLLEKELVAYVLIKDALTANKASIYAEYTDFSGEPLASLDRSVALAHGGFRELLMLDPSLTGQRLRKPELL